MKPSVPATPYVYALVDPDGSVFYVGKGTGRRMFSHERQAARGKQGARFDRIREIVAAGGSVACRVLGEYATDELAARAEVYFIASHDGLLNLTKGGEIGGKPVDWRQRCIDRAMELLGRIERAGKGPHPIARHFRHEIESPTPRVVEWSPEAGLVMSWRPCDE